MASYLNFECKAYMCIIAHKPLWMQMMRYLTTSLHKEIKETKYDLNSILLQQTELSTFSLKIVRCENSGKILANHVKHLLCVYGYTVYIPIPLSIAIAVFVPITISFCMLSLASSICGTNLASKSIV